jgi:hypothetical protein
LRDDSVSKAMFAKVDTYLLQSMRIKKEAVVSEVDQTEKRRILDMRRELATIPAKSPR